MKRFLVVTLFFLSGLAAQAQSQICYARWGYDPDCAFDVREGQVVFHGQFGPEVVLTYDDSRVYAGPTSFGSDIIYTIFGDKIFQGGNTFSDNVAYSVFADRVYYGNSILDQDIAYTFYNGNIYRGNSVSSSDLLFTVVNDGSLSLSLIVCIISGVDQ